MDFINSNVFSKHVLSDIYDIDEFILNVIPLLDKDNFEFYEIRDLIKRHSFVRYKDYKFTGNKRTNQIEISKKEISNEEYLEHRGVELIDNDNQGCGFEYCSSLNYEDFNYEPLFGFIITIFEDRDIKPFFTRISEWIDKTIGDGPKIVRLNELIDRITDSTSALKKLKKGWGNIVLTPINLVQEEVIEIHKNFNNVLLKELHSKYHNLLSKDGALKNEQKKLEYEIGFKLNPGYGSKSNLNNVLEHLIIGNFIEKTTFDIFKNAFNPSLNNIIETPIEWTGNIDELYYFISNLVKKGVINNRGKNYNKHIKYCRAIFRKGGVLTNNITGNHDEPSKKQEIDTIINYFKKEKSAVRV